LGSYSISDIETIDTTSGNLILSLPLAALPAGRGGNAGGGITLTYNSTIWDTHLLFEWNSQLVSYVPHDDLIGSNKGGWQYGIGYKVEILDKVDSYPGGQVPSCNGVPGIERRWRTQIIFPDGSTRVFRPAGYFVDTYEYAEVLPTGYLSRCVYLGPSLGYQLRMDPITPVSFYSTDGSGLRLEMNSPGGLTLYFPDGSKVENLYGTQRIYDRNNNYIEIQNIANYNGTGLPATKVVDQLNRSVVVVYDDYITGTIDDHVYQTGTGGEQLDTIVRWTWNELNKVYYSCDPSYSPDDPNYPNPVFLTWSSAPVVDQVILPSQAESLTYIFGYNGTSPTSPGWGELSSVTMPSGATATYQYESSAWNYIYPAQTLFDHENVTRKDLA
jgi:hypothetical protein